MVTYIKKNIPGFYADFAKKLDSNIYNNIGKTWEDFLNGKWVSLTPKQIQFRKENPNATLHEVFFKKLNEEEVTVNTIEDIKKRKELEIWDYDCSDEINAAFLNGNKIWYSKEERQSLKMRFEAEKDCGKEKTCLWYGNISIGLSINNAFSFLSQLENYAAECFDNTKRHIADMWSKESADEVLNYEYKIGYPEKLDLNYA